MPLLAKHRTERLNSKESRVQNLASIDIESMVLFLQSYLQKSYKFLIRMMICDLNTLPPSPAPRLMLKPDFTLRICFFYLLPQQGSSAKFFGIAEEKTRISSNQWVLLLLNGTNDPSNEGEADIIASQTVDEHTPETWSLRSSLSLSLFLLELQLEEWGSDRNGEWGTEMKKLKEMRVLTKGRMKRTAARIPVPGTCGTVTGSAVSTILHHNYRRPIGAECNPIVRALIIPCSPACKDMSRNSFLWEEMYFSRPSLAIQK